MKEQELVSGSDAMSIDAYHDTLERARKLSLIEQIDLVREILVTVKQTVVDTQARANPEKANSISQEENDAPLHDLMSYNGFAKDIWEGIDVEQYLNEERDSWDR